MQDHSSPRHISLRILFFVLLFACALPTLGQMEHLIHLTEEDGLPSNNVYGTLQDRTGALWFYTDNGIAKYKNKEFKIFSTEDGLPTNDIWSLHQDTLGRIWTVNSTDPFYYIDTLEKIHRIQVPHLPPVTYPLTLYYLPNGMIKIFPPFASFEGNEIIEYKDFTDLRSHHPILNINFPSSFITSSIIDDIHLSEQRKKEVADIISNHSVIVFFRNDDIIIVFKDKDVFAVFQHNETHYYVLAAHQYHIESTYLKDSILYFNHSKGQTQYNFYNGSKREISLPNIDHVNRVNQYDNLTIFNTQFDGAYMAIDNPWKMDSSPIIPTSICLLDSARCLLSNNKLFIQSPTGNKEIALNQEFYNFKNDQSCYYFNNNILIEINNDEVKIDTIDISTYYNRGQLQPNTDIKAISQTLFNSKYKVYKTESCALIKRNRKYLNFLFADSSGINLHIYETDLTSICIYQNQFIGSIKNQIFSFNYKNQLTPLLHFDTSDIISNLTAYQNYILVSFFNKPAVILKNLHPVFQFPSILPSKIIKQDGPNIALSDGKKIYIAHLLDQSLTSIDADIHIQNGVISDLDINGDSLFIIFKNHLYSLNFKHYHSPTYNISLSSAINHTPITATQYSFTKSSDHADLIINFDFQASGGLGFLTYHYKISPFHSTYLESTAPQITIDKIPKGNYTFSAFAVDPFGNQSNTIQSSLRILPPFSQTWYFLSAIILGATSILSLIIFAILKNQQAKQNQKLLLIKQFSTLELEALRSQMNPHFVFNALSAIQHFIRLSDKEHADDYLSKFATLIRKFLDYSKQNTVLIKNELQLINSYIEIENLRFDNAIQYSLLISPDVDTYESIPSLLIQPFVENAINHGLFHSKKYPKVLSISIHQTDNLTHINISDNGIGRHASKILYEQTRQDHQSRGLSMQQERINTINSAGDFFVHLKIDNLNHLDHSGTVVQLSIENKLL